MGTYKGNPFKVDWTNLEEVKSILSALNKDTKSEDRSVITKHPDRNN